MAISHLKTLRQRFCRAAGCRELIFVCPGCDRGQVYCSEDCRRVCRAEQQRAASRRYQKTPAGMLAHRIRQQTYRRRQAGASPEAESTSVTHQGHEDATKTKSRATPLTRETLKRWRESLGQFGQLICHFCSFKTAWVNPFYGGP